MYPAQAPAPAPNDAELAAFCDADADALRRLAARGLATAPERVVAARPFSLDGVENSRKLLVKWRGRPYDECTWERETDVSKFPAIIERFDARRHGPDTAAVKAARASGEETAGKTFSGTQPAWVDGGTWKDYQVEGVDWLRNSHERQRGETKSSVAVLRAPRYRRRRKNGARLAESRRRRGRDVDIPRRRRRRGRRAEMFRGGESPPRTFRSNDSKATPRVDSPRTGRGQALEGRGLDG